MIVGTTQIIKFLILNIAIISYVMNIEINPMTSFVSFKNRNRQFFHSDLIVNAPRYLVILNKLIY